MTTIRLLETPRDGAAAPLADDEGNVQFVGTATVILRVGGFTVLTDPNFVHAGDHVHLVARGLVPRKAGSGVQARALRSLR